MAKKPVSSKRGYATGGTVSPMSADDLRAAYARSNAAYQNMTPSQRQAQTDAARDRSGFSKLDDMGKAKGGKIAHTAGPKIGKDTGVIPAQRGEFVVKKSSTEKYGEKKMSAVNKGSAKIVAKPKKR